jgi:heme-degrading monooxygenase HmoA
MRALHSGQPHDWTSTEPRAAKCWQLRAPGRMVITRIWRGWTHPDDAEAYAEYIVGTGILAYKATPGNQGAYLISRRDGDRTEFLTISFWDSVESIKAFAGEDVNQAVFYPQDDRFLVDRETTVTHFDVHQGNR